MYHKAGCFDTAWLVVGVVVVENRSEGHGQAALPVTSATVHKLAFARRNAVLPVGTRRAGQQNVGVINCLSKIVVPVVQLVQILVTDSEFSTVIS